MRDERQVNNCDLRVDRDMSTFVIRHMHIYIFPRTLIFETFKGGGPPNAPSKSANVGDILYFPTRKIDDVMCRCPRFQINVDFSSVTNITLKNTVVFYVY